MTFIPVSVDKGVAVGDDTELNRTSTFVSADLALMDVDNGMFLSVVVRFAAISVTLSINAYSLAGDAMFGSVIADDLLFSVAPFPITFTTVALVSVGVVDKNFASKSVVAFDRVIATWPGSLVALVVVSVFMTVVCLVSGERNILRDVIVGKLVTVEVIFSETLVIMEVDIVECSNAFVNATISSLVLFAVAIVVCESIGVEVVCDLGVIGCVAALVTAFVVVNNVVL